MKRKLFLAATMLLVTLGMSAQSVTIELTPEQYQKIKDQAVREHEQWRTNNNDWGGLHVYAARNTEVTKAPKGILYGNSITEGWWRADEDFFHEYGLLGRGISGQVTSQMLCRFRQDVIDLHPGFVAILAGVNDIALNNGPISIEGTMNNIISMCELAKANGIRPVLCLLTPAARAGWRPQVTDMPDQIDKLNALIAAYGKKAHITVVDYYTPLVTDTRSMNPDCTRDGLHPTLDGYKIMEATLVKALKLKKQK